MEVKLLTQDGAHATLEVDVAPLGDKVKRRLLFAAVHMYEARRRVGTHATKTRAEVAGSNRKPWPQKGTGRARAGTRRSPLWRGGGIIHGPRPRDYAYRLPKKALREALRSALLGKFRDGEVVVAEGLDFPRPATKSMAALLRKAGVADRSVLVVTPALDRNVYLSCRNLPRVDCLPAAHLNAYEVLRHRCLVLARGAVSVLMERFS